MKYNTTKKRNNTVLNYEGERAYKLTKEVELYSMVVTTMMEDQFYRKLPELMKRMEELVSICNPEFTMKLGVYAREKMYLRTVPMVLAVLLAKNGKLKKKYVTRIIQRADELSEILAIYKVLDGKKKLKPLPKALQRGVAEAFSKFDEYQFGKYKNAKKDISLKLAMRFCRPKPGEGREELYKKIRYGEKLKSYTWEVELSSTKEKGKTKEQVWKELVDSKRIGYMALMRNLRNILECVSDKNVIEKVCQTISNKNNVLKSKQFPFRFLAAYLELKDQSYIHLHMVLEALETAILHSIENITGFENDDTVLIASDVSRSMMKKISNKSKIEHYDIGLTLSMLLQTKCNCITGIFGDIFKVKQFPKNTVLRNVYDLKRIEGEVGYSTNGYKVIEYANNMKFDKIIFFTDGQMYSSYRYDVSNILQEWKKYRKNINQDARLYLFDLSGYGNTPIKFNSENVTFIAGWSDKIFDMLHALENGSSIVKEIDKIEI